MTIYAGLKRDAYEYQSDDTHTYQVGLALENGGEGGFSVATVGANPSYPRGWQMRRVYGVAADGTRSELPIASPSNTLFVNGGSFSKGGVSFTIEGKRGEHRFNKGI